MKEYSIDSFTSVITGGTPSTSKEDYWSNGKIPWLNSGELQQDIITKSSNFITESGLKNSSTKLMPKDTVLIALTGTTTGKVGYLTFEACANQSVTGILPSKKHISKYLYYYLNSIRKKVINDAYGGAQPHISQGYVKQIKIPLPSLQVQKRIAQILDDAAALRNKTVQILKEYDVLSQAIFLDMFGDPVTNIHNFPVGTIRDLVKEAKYGTSEKASDVGQYPYLRMNNLTYKGFMDYSNLKYVDIPQKDLNKYIIVKGDLLFNRTNSEELVGKTAIFDSSEPMIAAGYLIRVRFNEKASPYFVSYYLNSQYGKLVLKNMCKSIVGMANINAQEMQDIKILIPPIDLQNQFAEKIALIEQQKELVKQELKESEDLFNCLLQKAFKGELV